MNKYILGISCYFHDSAVCLIKNGVIVSAVQEERFTGIKNDSSFPYRSIEWVTTYNNITINNIDYIIFYEKPLKKFLRIINSSIDNFPKSREYFLSQMRRWLSEKLWTKTNIAKKINANLKQIIFCQHHLSHASSIYYNSNINDSVIMVSDGVGEDQSFSIWKAQENVISLLYEIKYPKSLGLFYSCMTSYLGHSINSGENKVMSMSAFGNNELYEKILKIINLDKNKIFNQNFKFFNYQFSLKKSYSDSLINLLGESRSYQEKFIDDNFKLIDGKSIRYANIANSTQKITEQIINKKSNLAYELYPSKNLCISGGVHLNCVANYNALKNSKFNKIYSNNCSSDSGGAIGSSLWAWNNLVDTNYKPIKQNIYTGPQFTNDEIEQNLNQLKIKYIKFNSSKDLINFAVDDLIEGKVIAWFQNKLEFGKRALGNRSILAKPNDIDISKHINNNIKKREPYQPFAASVLNDKINDFFIENKKFEFSYKFMNIIAECRKEYYNELRGILHIDNTSRIQAVNFEDNALFYNLIENFYIKTKLPILLNTSFNLRGETIVDNPIKAISTFIRSKCDSLYLGHFKISNDH